MATKVSRFSQSAHAQCMRTIQHVQCKLFYRVYRALSLGKHALVIISCKNTTTRRLISNFLKSGFNAQNILRRHLSWTPNRPEKNRVTLIFLMRTRQKTVMRSAKKLSHWGKNFLLKPLTSTYRLSPPPPPPPLIQMTKTAKTAKHIMFSHLSRKIRDQPHQNNRNRVATQNPSRFIT